LSHIDAVLAFGGIKVQGRLAGSSNATLQVLCEADGESTLAVYKPRKGERPLWDFPQGSLGHREVAMSILDRRLGWDLVPPTVWREEGPYGPGSCQLWIDVDPGREAVVVAAEESVPEGWFAVAQGEDEDGELVVLAHDNSPALRRMTLLDVLANNADRKGGHVLLTGTGSVAAIDHGVTFHVDDKLRTVLWGWAGAPINVAEQADLQRLAGEMDALEQDIHEHLTGREFEALAARLEVVLSEGCFPTPTGAWPALPWPAM